MADVPDPELPGPLGSCDVPGGGFCDDFDDWGLDLDREPPSEEELHGLVFDPDNSPPEGWELMSDDQRRELLGGDLYPDEDGEDARPEALEAGFTHRYGGTGTGFAAGGPLDVMLPGPDLAWHAGAARQRGLDALSDDELIGVLGAARRLQSWQAELELAVVAELDARRAGPDGRDGQYVADELAAALTVTGRSAGSLLELSRRLGRLPHTRALLAAGAIDRPRAAVIADQLALLTDADAAAVEDAIAARAGAMTTGRLAAACQRAVLAHDPQAAARRKERAEQDARVECWAEPAGTGAIAGRDLNLAAVIAADKYLDAAARWLRQHGAPGTVDQLRAQAFVARLTGQPLQTLLPQPADPASPGGPDSATPGGLTGTVNLVMPATTWLGLADTPGETGGHGTTDAATCRDLAAALANHGDSRWCLTLTGPHGRAVAHGCARAGPGPPGHTDPAAWLRQITITPVETGTCAHRRLPATRLTTPPDQDPQPPLRLPRLPPPRRPLRRRPHHPPPPGRQDLRMQLVSAMPAPSPGQTGTRLAPHPARPRHPDLDHPQRPPLHGRPGTVPVIAVGSVWLAHAADDRGPRGNTQ